ncbi:MAG: protein kinase [Symploca sp. SIO2E6]|nr:protein kinase [Symploca sp. SIO2E6]
MESLLNNRYRIIRTLGSGGFGETFLAEDTHMPSCRRCVIKQLKPVTTNPQVHQLVQERFGREAAILEELGTSSAQIPNLYAYFTEQGQFYLIQEFIEGETLGSLVQQQGSFSEDSVQKILLNILPVLDYVHSKRIVHRDIKPDNIMLRSWDDLPVLIDFGAVRETMGTMVNSQGNSTSSIVIGTPGFMPSEQAAGRPMYSSDLYSLGLTAIYLLTGKLPQQLETDPLTGEIIWQAEGLSPDSNLAAVLEKGIKSHGRDRYATAREMLNALQGSTAAVSPTIPLTPIPPTILPPPIPATQPPIRTNSQVPTQAVSPKAVPPTNPPPNNQGSSKGIIIASAIAGTLIGGSIIAGLVITNQPNQPTPKVSTSPITPTAISPSPIAPPTVSPSPTTPPVVVPSPTAPPTVSPSPTTPPTPTPTTADLDQIFPNYVSAALSPETVFTECPGNTNFQLVGETPSFHFAVCGENRRPKFYVGQDKSSGDGIQVPWGGRREGFRNGSFLYQVPNLRNSNFTDPRLRVYQSEKLLVDEEVTRLYRRQPQNSRD